jgi:hypothetical protein
MGAHQGSRSGVASEAIRPAPLTACEFRTPLDRIEAIRSRVYEALFYALVIIGGSAALAHLVYR